MLLQYAVLKRLFGLVFLDCQHLWQHKTVHVALDRNHWNVCDHSKMLIQRQIAIRRDNNPEVTLKLTPRLVRNEFKYVPLAQLNRAIQIS